MARKIAAACALIAFAICLFLGMDAENSFSTTVKRALIAMGATFVIGLIVGAMAETMAKENRKPREKMGNSEAKPVTHDR